MTNLRPRITKTGLIAMALFASVFAAGLFTPQQTEAAGWSYVRTWSGKKYYACKYSNTYGRVKVTNTTTSRKTFIISGNTYNLAASNPSTNFVASTYVTLSKSYSFDVDGYKFSFKYGYTGC